MKAIITFCLLFSAFAINAQQALTGVWNTGTDGTKIEITKVDGIYTGKLISSDNVKAKIGRTILKEVKRTDGAWKGKLYSPKKDNWYDALLEEKANQLLITIKAGWMSKTVEWQRE
ncbi:MAG: DUF2147 domain-containing protein [Phaeodactylibacter sp.]|nr:DUF2147 domain-containing protein [Phaeodactylibacter sp.]